MNRIPYIVLGVLVLVAVVYRLANPPQPTPPGPRGEFPSWRSGDAVGKMSSQAVNPGGTMWAGAWNEEEAEVLRSAVWIVDFADHDARLAEMKKGWFTSYVGWADDNTARVLLVDAKNPNVVSESDVAYIDADSAKIDRTVPLKNPVKRILVWPAGSEKFVAELVHEGAQTRLAVLSESGEIIGKVVEPELPEGAKFYADAALSAEGDAFVFSISDKAARGGRAYYIADTRQGNSKKVFDLKDIPGRLEGMWVVGNPRYISELMPSVGDVVATVLMVCSEKEKFRAAEHAFYKGKIETLKKGVGKTALQEYWPDAPEQMLFVTYNGGYRFDLASGKTKKLFGYSDLRARDEMWRREVRNGRLYPIEGGYISVSVNANRVDIREMNKKGIVERNLLPRQ